MKTLEVVDSLAALAQASRLVLLRMLVKRGKEGCTPSQLAETLDIPAPTLSFHLKELQRAGLIQARRDGRFLFYSPNFSRLNELIGFLAANCGGVAVKDGRSSYSASATDTLQPKRKRA